MLSLVAPWWLLGLLALPLIRWLHRGGRHRRALPVAHLGLWQAAAQRSPAAGEKQPPDPAWRRRALYVALLVLALAQPQWTSRPGRVTLWLDDSASMLTREPGGTRLALALAAARAQLADQPDAEVEVRLLSEPWRAQPLAADTAAAALALGGRIAARVAGQAMPPGQGASAPSPAAAPSATPAAPPAAPPAALLAPDRAHWLLTDGAHPALQQWPGQRRPSRLIRVGQVDGNVGLERLVVRRSADRADHFDVLLRLGNGGSGEATRDVVLAAGSRELARASLKLAAGQAELLQFTVPAAPRLRATLQPGDALAEDDVIELDLAPLRRRGVALDAGCPAALRAAVVAHPGLVPAEPGVAEVALTCSGAVASAPTAVPALPALIVRAERLPTPLAGAVQWSAAVPPAARVALDATRWRAGARLDARAGDLPLFAAGGEPLVVMRGGTPRRIETALDFTGPSAGADGELPLLVNWLFERLLDAPLLDEAAGIERGADAWRVVPAPTSASAASPSAAPTTSPTPSPTRSPTPSPDATSTSEPGGTAVASGSTLRDATRPLAALALMVLLWELAALARQWRRLTRPAVAPARPRSAGAGPEVRSP